jgi:hypothetical protein
MVDPCRTEVVLRRLRVSVILSRHLVTSRDPKLVVRNALR